MAAINGNLDVTDTLSSTTALLMKTDALRVCLSRFLPGPRKPLVVGNDPSGSLPVACATGLELHRHTGVCRLCLLTGVPADSNPT